MSFCCRKVIAGSNLGNDLISVASGIAVVHIVDCPLNRSDVFLELFGSLVLESPLIIKLIDRLLATAVRELFCCEPVEAIDLFLSCHKDSLLRG